MIFHSKFGPRVCVFAALLAVPLLPPIANAAGAPWLPLAVGNHWHYASTGGEVHDESITGTLTLLGREVFVKTFTGGANNGLENYWMSDSDGSVLLAGFNNRSASFALAYDPPIAVLRAPPSVGLTWSTHADLYSLPDLAAAGTLDLQWSVVEDVVLSVPAGSFPTFGATQLVLNSAARGPKGASSGTVLALDGRRLPATAAEGAATAQDWYAAGVGVVQSVYSGLDQLVSFDGPTPVAGSSWARLKRIYR